MKNEYFKCLLNSEQLFIKLLFTYYKNIIKNRILINLHLY